MDKLHIAQLFSLCFIYQVLLYIFCRNINMYQINGQTVLQEEYDENYEPTEEGIFLDFYQLTVAERM